MGIEGLTSWIRQNHPNAVSKKNITDFSGRRIAVDATNICYEIWSACFRDVVKITDVIAGEVDRREVTSRCITRLYDYLRRIISCGVLPVFVFDGEYSQDKAEHAHVKRKVSKDKSKNRLSVLDEEIASLDPSLRKGKYLEERRKILCQTEGPEEEMQMMKMVLLNTPLPCIQAKGEAEKLCSQLCYEGKVDAVFSSDSDNLPNGCLMLLTKMVGTEDGEVSEAFSLPAILESTGLSFSSFVDFCIMAGCDYNSNMPGIGIVRAFKLISEYGNIENLPSTYLKKPVDTSILNYQRCRELFSLQSSEEMTDELVLDLGEGDPETLRELGVFWGNDLSALLFTLPKLEEQSIVTRLI
ncbi:Flap endonuclease 1 [Brazilian cedratvirus IHUMI]|uniref:Flap endonuclease 1 n=1 Tax=Brazilian cedratvirus IHUMI TaxID=2126980 RepID=A0A2R8FDM0_9VIRU|nr:Flap endonuclease 1 [Brazilian cedratvirus IHUMI]